MNQTRLLPLTIATISSMLLSGWVWPWMYGSKEEALKACGKWSESGPKKTVTGWEYTERLKDASGQTWDYLGLNLPKRPPVPGEWSPPTWVPRKSDIPPAHFNLEVKSWKRSYIVLARSCLHEPETRQILGRQKETVVKRFKY